MKILAPHYEYMKKAISAHSPESVAVLRAHIVKEGKAKDIEKRLRWDLSYSAGLSQWLCDYVYRYADDTHIDTALRQIMRESYGH